jgi:hypothetical protein
MDTDDSSISPALRLMRMIDGYWLSQVIHVAAKLGVADHLADGPKTSHALAREIAADSDALHRLLRACAAFGLLRESESQMYESCSIAGPITAVTHFLHGEIAS